MIQHLDQRPLAEEWLYFGLQFHSESLRWCGRAADGWSRSLEITSSTIHKTEWMVTSPSLPPVTKPSSNKSVSPHNLPKQHHELWTNFSNTWAYGGCFLLQPQSVTWKKWRWKWEERPCGSRLSITTKTWDAQLPKRKCLLWLTVLEVFIYVWLVLLFWVCGRDEHHGRSMWEIKLLPSWPEKEENREKETGFHSFFKSISPTIKSSQWVFLTMLPR